MIKYFSARALLVALIMAVSFPCGAGQAAPDAPPKTGERLVPAAAVAEASEEDKAHWLSFAALYEVLHHDRTAGYNRLFCQTCQNTGALLRSAINRDWKIQDRDGALQRLDMFFAPDYHAEYETRYQAILRGEYPDGQTETNLEELQSLFDAYLQLQDPDILHVDTVAAWEYMRCANLTKMCFNAGYITEEEAWGYLQQNAAMAEQRFDTWEDYFVSFMLARTIFYRSSELDMYVQAARRLFADPACAWYGNVIRTR